VPLLTIRSLVDKSIFVAVLGKLIRTWSAIDRFGLSTDSSRTFSYGLTGVEQLITPLTLVVLPRRGVWIFRSFVEVLRSPKRA